MKVLHLTLKKKWFDMIASGEKKEEYREIKPYWAKKFLMDVGVKDLRITPLEICEAIKKGSDEVAYDLDIESVVKFARGGHFHKSIPQISLRCLGIHVGEGKPEWGAEPGKKYFVIKLGERFVMYQTKSNRE